MERGACPVLPDTGGQAGLRSKSRTRRPLLRRLLLVPVDPAATRALKQPKSERPPEQLQQSEGVIYSGLRGGLGCGRLSHGACGGAGGVEHGGCGTFDAAAPAGHGLGGDGMMSRGDCGRVGGGDRNVGGASGAGGGSGGSCVVSVGRGNSSSSSSSAVDAGKHNGAGVCRASSRAGAGDRPGDGRGAASESIRFAVGRGDTTV